MARKLIHNRKQADYEFAPQLWHQRIITTSKNSFEISNLMEIESLMANGVLQLLQYDSNKNANISLFKSRFVYKIKVKVIDKPYKKSYLMVQDYNDKEIMALLTKDLTS